MTDMLSDRDMYAYYDHIRQSAPVEFKYMKQNLRFCDGTMQKYLESRWSKDPLPFDGRERENKRVGAVVNQKDVDQNPIQRH